MLLILKHSYIVDFEFNDVNWKISSEKCVLCWKNLQENLKETEFLSQTPNF